MGLPRPLRVTRLKALTPAVQIASQWGLCVGKAGSKSPLVRRRWPWTTRLACVRTPLRAAEAEGYWCTDLSRDHIRLGHRI